MTPTPDSAPRSCASCGRPLAAGAAFCRGCGAPAAATAPTPPAAAAPPTQPLPPPSAPPRTAPPQPPAPSRARAWGRPVLIAALAGLLVGGGVAAAIVLLGGGDSKQTSGPVPGSSATVPAGETTSNRSGEASSSGEEAGGFPPASEAQMASEIQEVILAFHEDVVAERFQAAWGLLSVRKRAQYMREEGYAAWVEDQSSLTPYLAPAGLTVHIDELEEGGVARVLLTGMGWSEPGSPCSEWRGLTWVKYEGGHWTYDPGYSATADRRRLWKPRASELLGEGCLAP